MKSIRIGTRGSTLALAQTAWVKEKLKEKYPDALNRNDSHQDERGSVFRSKRSSDWW